MLEPFCTWLWPCPKWDWHCLDPPPPCTLKPLLPSSNKSSPTEVRSLVWGPPSQQGKNLKNVFFPLPYFFEKSCHQAKDGDSLDYTKNLSDWRWFYRGALGSHIASCWTEVIWEDEVLTFGHRVSLMEKKSLCCLVQGSEWGSCCILFAWRCELSCQNRIMALPFSPPCLS